MDDTALWLILVVLCLAFPAAADKMFNGFLMVGGLILTVWGLVRFGKFFRNLWKNTWVRVAFAALFIALFCLWAALMSSVG